MLRSILLALSFPLIDKSFCMCKALKEDCPLEDSSNENKIALFEGNSRFLA
jgi:hypothetical protein